MKKDFTQPLETTPTRVYILVEDNQGDKGRGYGVLDMGESGCAACRENGEVGAVMVLEQDTKRDLTLQLIEFLSGHGLVLKRYRELARETIAQYSFIDDTPGESYEAACLLVGVDLTDKLNDHLIWFSFSFLAEYITKSHFRNTIVYEGMCRLDSER